MDNRIFDELKDNALKINAICFAENYKPINRVYMARVILVKYKEKETAIKFVQYIIDYYDEDKKDLYKSKFKYWVSVKESIKLSISQQL